MPSPSVITQTDIALHHVATTTDFAETIAQRGVGMANRITTVRSANSRPKIHEVRKANRIPPPTATACASRLEECRPVRDTRGELCFCTDQSELAGARGVFEDDHEQPGRSAARVRSRPRSPRAPSSGAP